MARGDSERRNKKKDKYREKKKHPYKKGGRFRSIEITTKKVEVAEEETKGKKKKKKK